MRLKVLAAGLSRIGMSPLTMSVPILGAITSDDLILSSGYWLYLAIVGLCAHIFGFGLNDIIDYPLDKTARRTYFLEGLSGWLVWIWVILVIPISTGVYRILLHGSGIGVSLLCLSGIASVTYNKWSKWGKVPSLVAEIGLAISIGLLCLSGSLIDNVSQISIQPALYAITLAFVLLLLNSVPSGLKDIKTDSDFGVKSFVISTNTGMLSEDEIFISNALRFYSVFVQGIIFILFFSLIVLFEVNLLATFMTVVLSFYAALHLRMLLVVNSFRALRESMPLLSGYFNFAALLMIIIGRVSMVGQAIIVLYVVLLLMIPLWIGFRVWRYRYARAIASNLRE